MEIHSVFYRITRKQKKDPVAKCYSSGIWTQAPPTYLFCMLLSCSIGSWTYNFFGFKSHWCNILPLDFFVFSWFCRIYRMHLHLEKTRLVKGMNSHQCLYACASMWIKKTWLLCWSSRHSRCCTRGKSEESFAHRQQSTQATDPPWHWTPQQTSPEVQNRGISAQKDLCPLKFF